MNSKGVYAVTKADKEQERRQSLNVAAWIPYIVWNRKKK